MTEAENRKMVIGILRKYELSDDAKSYRIFLGYALLFVATLVMSVLCFSLNPWLGALAWPLLFLSFSKFFIFVHDCEHFNFFKSKRMNKFAGMFAGFFIFLPGTLWKKIHDSHHGATGHLNDRENNPGFSIMTVDEYLNGPQKESKKYRFMSSIFTKTIIFPLALLIVARIPLPRHGMKNNIAILCHDLFYGGILFALIHYGWGAYFLIVYMVPILAFYTLSSILFFLQHQYEETYWAGEQTWDLYTASVQGSSYLKFGPFMAWLTSNVGCHHVHHLNPNIPYYNLQEATDKTAPYFNINSIQFKDLFKHMQFVLWDEKNGKAVTIKSLRKK